MEITNLMLNDYVMIHCFDGSDIVIKVTEIEGEGCTVYGISKQGNHWSYIEDVEPIPLTLEILEKNGFERRDDLVVDDEFLPFVLEILDTNDSFEIIIYWRDSYSNGAADAFNEVSWDEYWKLHILSGPALYEYETGNCIYVHELQHALKLCHVEKEIVL